jgi:hypothetical protein
MKLLTKEIKKKLPALYSQENKKPEDVKVIVKFFDPMGAWTWYATEYDGKDTFFGYVRGHEAELGHFALSDLVSISRYRRLGIERDRHFGFDNTLQDVMDKQL